MVQAGHTYHVELDLKPTDKNYGNDAAEAQSSLHASLQPDVPWTYSSSRVPDVLSKRGMGLESWKRAVEGASQLWKERTVTLGTAAQECNRRSLSRFLMVFVIIMIVLFLLGRLQDPDYWSWIFVGFTNAIVIMSVHGPFLKAYTERLSEFEQKWSSLARELNDECFFKNRGVTVETVRTNVVKRGRRLAWTIGLRFILQIQPVDEEDVAWCSANSQTSDVQNDEYENRTLRVTKELQFEGVAHEGNVCHGAHSTVAMAIAVVDNDGGAEPSSDVGAMAEKRTLLDLV